MGLVGTHSGWTPRRAGLQNTHGSCTHLPANEILPSSEPWGLKVWDTKANANTASLLGKADTGSFPEEHPSCFHTTFSSLSEREGRTQCFQTWRAIAIHKQFYLHLLGSDAVQELANPDGPLITQLTAPALLEGGCFETQSLPWIESILASCVSARHAACWFYPNKELDSLDPSIIYSSYTYSGITGFCTWNSLRQGSMFSFHHFAGFLPMLKYQKKKLKHSNSEACIISFFILVLRLL